MDAEVTQVVRVLRSFGVLTRHAICERVGGERWPDHQFEATLKQGVREGRIRALGDDLFELGEREQD
jgi:hypothetical protein